MATEKSNPAVKPAEDDPARLVQIKLFKDNGKYKDALFVSVNDYRAQIPRGQVVTVPFYVAKHLEEMFEQDQNTASLISQHTAEFSEKARALT